VRAARRDLPKRPHPADYVGHLLPEGEGFHRSTRDGNRDRNARALELIDEIVVDHGPVMFHQSGGCCDGSSPMCYPKGEFLIGDYDVKMGEIGGAPFYISGSQYEAWKHTDIVIDVVRGRGGMFSLDNGREKRFLVRSEMCEIPASAKKTSAEAL
jgi:uncharacterized protein (DUF779 family)